MGAEGPVGGDQGAQGGLVSDGQEALGDSVTLTTANDQTTKPPTTPPAAPATTTPAKPSATPAPDKPSDTEAAPSPSASHTPVADEAASSAAAPEPEGSLAHTGADTTPWLLSVAGLLLAVGAGVAIAARRRRTDDKSDDHPAES